jgi:transcriptional regulator with XRE-family HTH domain
MKQQNRLISRLRPFRRRWGFSQRELALLLGTSNHASVSKLEAFKVRPSANDAIAAAIIFDASIVEVFPHLYALNRQAVSDRASRLYDELQGSTHSGTRDKLDFLERLLARLSDDEPSPLTL